MGWFYIIRLIYRNRWAVCWVHVSRPMYGVSVESEGLKKRNCSNPEWKSYLKCGGICTKTKVSFSFNSREHIYYIFQQISSISRIKTMHRCEKCRNRRIASYRKTSYVIPSIEVSFDAPYEISLTLLAAEVSLTILRRHLRSRNAITLE